MYGTGYRGTVKYRIGVKKLFLPLHDGQHPPDAAQQVQAGHHRDAESESESLIKNGSAVFLSVC